MYIAMMLKIVICILECISKHKTWMCCLHFPKLNVLSYVKKYEITIYHLQLFWMYRTTRVRLVLIICSIEFIVFVCNHTLIIKCGFIRNLVAAIVCVHVCTCVVMCAYVRLSLCLPVWPMYLPVFLSIDVYGYVYMHIFLRTCKCTHACLRLRVRLTSGMYAYLQHYIYIYACL